MTISWNDAWAAMQIWLLLIVVFGGGELLLLAAVFAMAVFTRFIRLGRK